jgi:hypothetical protein
MLYYFGHFGGVVASDTHCAGLYFKMQMENNHFGLLICWLNNQHHLERNTYMGKLVNRPYKLDFFLRISYNFVSIGVYLFPDLPPLSTARQNLYVGHVDGHVHNIQKDTTNRWANL